MQLSVIPKYIRCATDSLVLPDTLPAFICEQISRQDSEFAAHYGQIQPILITLQGGRQQVLSGFSTFLALKKAGFSQIICWVLPQAVTPALAFGQRILHDRQALLSSPILQAWLLKEAVNLLPAQDILPLLALMGLKPQQHLLAERIKLLHLDTAVQAALHSQKLHIKNLPHLLRLPPEEQNRLVELIRQYRLSGSKQQKLLELMLELYLREGSSIDGILAEWRQTGPPRDNLPQESQSLLNYLHFRSNPRLAYAEAHFDEQLRCLQPPAQVSISHTPAFEDEQVSVQLSYSSWAALQAHWPQVLKAVERGNQDP